MKKSIALAVAAALLACFVQHDARAAFTISIDGNTQLGFGNMRQGDEMEVAERGGYHHSVHCVSDNGRFWRLRLRMLMPFRSSAFQIPSENFSAIVEQIATGQGNVPGQTNRDIPLIGDSAEIYISAGADNSGTEVQLNMKYKLKVPENQAAGGYYSYLEYVMYEQL